MSRPLTIIGAGIAGLVAAALAHARGHAVTVVDAGASAGGLWKSTEVRLGEHRLSLDAGLRLPVATGDERLDRLIFHRPDFAFDWVRIDGWPRESAITAHRFNPENSCIDATTLGPRLDQAIAEMRAARNDGDRAASALDHSLRTYGPTLTHGPIRDAALGLFGLELADLEPQAVQWFIPRRMILGDSVATARLLADEDLAGRVAHARHCDLPAGLSRSFLRPRTGGISTWTVALQRSLQQAGVDFLFGDRVRLAEFDARTNAISALALTSGRRLEVDHVLCTIAPSLLAGATGFRAGPPPPFLDLAISHVLVDRAPEHRANYGLNFNPDARFFRAIFHDAIGDVPAGAHVLTFEHLVTGEGQSDLAAEALAELVRCGGMPAGSRAIDASTERYRNSVPVPVRPFGRDAAALRDAMAASIPNLLFAGRSAGGAPFLDAIIHEIEATLTHFAAEPHHA